MNVGVAVGVAVFVGELVGVFVAVLVGVLVAVGVEVKVFVGVLVGVLVAVFVGVFVGVLVGVAVLVGVLVGVFEGVLVIVLVGVFVRVLVGVGVGGTPLVKQTVTSWSDGVETIVGLLRKASYLRYRKPLNWESEAPLAKKVPEVPSGPTKANGPSELLLAAAWILTSVPAGIEAFQVIVVQNGNAPAAGLASFSPETWVPVPSKTKVRKAASVEIPPPVGIAQVAPEVEEIARAPPP